MPGPVLRNKVVKHFGTPDVTDGSLNEPREREENGFRFNEKWHYKHPNRDPAGAIERILYWHRYDYVGSMIRTERIADWHKDTSLPEKLQG